MVALKMLVTTDRFGDTAAYLQVIENIASRGVPVSQLEANLIAYQESGIVHLTAAEIAKDPLAPPAVNEANEFHGHLYLILYPIAAFTKILPTDFVIVCVDVLSFMGLVLLAYFFLRQSGISIVASCLFCLTIVSHPAWSQGLLYGQFYPDRIFLVGGLALALVTMRKTPSRLPFIGAALFCLLIHERAAIYAGTFLLLYVGLYWKSSGPDRLLKLGAGIALLLYGFVSSMFFLEQLYNGNFFKAANFIALFQNQDYIQYTLLYLLANAVFLILALFEPRAALIAFVLMLPNIFGNIGGAEKTGWSTHYQSYYLPVLIWAAIMGFISAYNRFATRLPHVALLVLTALGSAALMSLGPDRAEGVNVSLDQTPKSFFPTLVREATTWLGPAGVARQAAVNEARIAIPEGSVATVPEALMAVLYERRTLRFFPFDIDHADYAVLAVTGSEGGRVTYGGFSGSRLGPEEDRKINEVLLARMRADRYDFAHPTFLPVFGSAVLKRTH